MHEYKAVLRKVVNGDTLRLDIDLGFHTWIRNIKIGLDGIVDIGTDKAMQYINAWMGNVNAPLVVQVHRHPGWSVTVWRRGESTNPNTSLNALMVRDGMTLEPNGD